MPRKNRFTREEIISAALELTRSRGIVAVTARSLAGALGSSSKPIFGLFENMDEVQQEVQKAAFAIYQKRIADAMASGEFPPFKASGMAYIRFAREERELFRLLFMRDRSHETIGSQDEEIRPLLALIQKRRHRRGRGAAAPSGAVGLRPRHRHDARHVLSRLAGCLCQRYADRTLPRHDAALYQKGGGLNMEAIQADRLVKRYRDVTAVDGLTLSIREGELFALLGVNGAGKTTTVKMLSCLTQPTAGDARLLGHSVVSEPAAVKRLIGVSPQETAVAPKLSVRENLGLMCGVHGFSKEKRRRKTAELAEALELTGVLRKQAGKLSGGWQRRLSIAMALIGEPKILFLDEPTLGLDVIARSELWDVIRALKGRITVILTTHYMEEAEALSDRIGIMKHGRLVALGTAGELKRQAGAEKFEDAFIKLVKEAQA